MRLSVTLLNKLLWLNLDLIQLRHGSNGFVRRQTISYLFKKILEKLVPSHVRYLVFSCLSESGYFQKIRGRKLAKTQNPIKERGKFGDFIEKETDPDSHIWKEISHIGLNEEQIRNLKKAKAPVLKLRDKLCKEMNKFIDIKKKIMKLSKEIESTFNKMAAKTYPIQRAKFCLYIDKVKNKKELSVFELWGIKKNHYKITKIVKKNLEDYPTIKRDYDMQLKKKILVKKDESNEDEQITKIFEGDNWDKVEETSAPLPRYSQDSCEMKEYEWHNYIYDQLDNSEDSGCPESDFEVVE